MSTLESETAETTARTVSGSRRATRGRMLVDRVMTILAFVALVLAIAPLIMILADVVVKGMPAMSISFLTNLPTPVGVPGGGIANALVGTFVMVGIATLISVPIGVGAGIFFSEWPESRLSLISSFMNDVLAEFPSIVVGIFVYVVIVLTTHSFSAVAGAVALSIIMIPVIARTTEESLKIVPVSLREASLALGVSRWRTVIRVVISTAKTGLVTGILLAVARAAGETAPLILTALGSTLYATGLFQPTAAVPLLIYQYGISPFADWQARAWGAALVLVFIMLALNLSVKAIVGRRFAGIRAET